MPNDFNSSGREACSELDSRDEQAMRWLVKRDRGLNAGETAQLCAWLGADAANQDAFSRAASTWKAMDRLGDIKALSRAADGIVRRGRQRRSRARRALFGVLGAAAAVVLVLAGLDRGDAAATSAEAPAVAGNSYQVLESTARRVTLPDGSVVELNGDSRIAVEFTAEERRVRLIAGEAHFSVAKDAAHPFLVTAQGVTVRAVGTAFNVRMDNHSIQVLVTEGQILLQGEALAAAESEPAKKPALGAGQRAVVSLTAPGAPLSIGRANALEIDQTLAWQSARLVFDRTSLQEVAAAFNRYNARQLVLGSPDLRERALSGVFRADNLDGFIRLLQVTSDVQATERSSLEVVLLPKK